LECNMAYANICFGENCRLYSNVKISVIGGAKI
jgi:hypothetical protein